MLGHGAESAEYAAKLANAGVATVNEARRTIGLPPIPGGDALRCPVNTEPLDQWTEREPPTAGQGESRIILPS